MNVLDVFARVHQYDERKTFKEEWSKFIEDPENEEMFKAEANRLIDAGFSGDPYDKMFKSVRYYFRKKLNQQTNQQTKEKKNRKEYEGVGKEVLAGMEKHIKNVILENININNLDSKLLICKISPADGFDHYCIENKQSILEELEREKGGNKISKEDVENIMAKFKKSYKNSFYRFRLSLHG
jgi:hypothetical protein